MDHGVTHVQLSFNLSFEDGYIVTVSSPNWTKDIRQGSYFSDAEVEEILAHASYEIAQLVAHKTLRGLRAESIAEPDGQKGKRHPKNSFGIRFSDN